MKLVRLSTNDSNAFFDNSFENGIEIKEKSNVALQNISIELDEDEIEIDATNNRITYQFSGATILNVVIPSGTYQKIDLGSGTAGTDLLYEITNAINAALSANQNQIGTEFLVSFDGNNRVQIQFKSTASTDPGKINKAGYPITTTNKVTRGGTAGNGVYGRSDIGTDRTSYLYVDQFVARGAGLWQAQISAKTAAGELIFGYVTQDPKTITSFTDSVFKYAIIADNIGVDYSIILDGVRSTPASSRALALNDYMEVDISAGQVLLRVFDSPGGTETLIDSLDYDGRQKLYPVCVFAATSANRITNLHFTPSGYQTTADLSVNDDEIVPIIGAIPNQQGIQNKVQFLRFESSVVANWLGYFNTRYPAVGTVTVKEIGTFTADEISASVDLGQNLIIELLSFNLDSHDGLDGKRRNILATIPEESNQGAVQYAPPYPLFIDINNATPLSIRNIRARVLKRDLTPVKINGNATMCLLFGQ